MYSNTAFSLVDVEGFEPTRLVVTGLQPVVTLQRHRTSVSKDALSLLEATYSVFKEPKLSHEGFEVKGGWLFFGWR